MGDGKQKINVMGVEIDVDKIVVDVMRKKEEVYQELIDKGLSVTAIAKNEILIDVESNIQSWIDGLNGWLEMMEEEIKVGYEVIMRSVNEGQAAADADSEECNYLPVFDPFTENDIAVCTDWTKSQPLVGDALHSLYQWDHYLKEIKETIPELQNVLKPKLEGE